MSLWSRISNVFRGERLSREIDEEFESHIEEAVGQGRDPEEARRAFGAPLRQRERSRDVRVVVWLDALRADVVFGWRQIVKRKVTSVAAILSLALAIGACTSAFRLVDALLLRPLPVASPERLQVVAFESPHALTGKMVTYDSCSYPMFLRMRAALRGQAESLAVSYAERSDLTYRSDPEMEKAYRQFVSGWMFGTFGLQPALGRLLTENDDLKPGATPWAVLSYDYWTRRFGRDAKVIGRKFRMDNDLYEIVGVAPEGFTGTETGTVTDVFIPMAMKNPQTLASSNNFWLRTLVQLKPGVSPDPVRERLRATFHAIQEERAKGFVNLSRERRQQFFREQLLLLPAAAGRSNLQRDYGEALAALGVLVGLVLLIACANVANLMTVRAAARSREMALRVSIGAGRWRLVQLVMVESAWIAFLATLLGAVLAWWSAPFIAGMISSPDNPARLELPLDWRVLSFGLAVACGVTFLFGLMPAARASAVRPSSALKGGEDPHSRRRLMHAMIAVQVAFCFVVHFAAGLFIVTFDRLSNQPLGFSPERVLNLETLTNQPQAAVFWYEVAAQLRAVPGVDNVAIAGWPLMSGESGVGDISVDGADPGGVFSDFYKVSHGWLDTLKVRLIAGRDFRPDETSPGFGIVNRAFAKQYFRGENPVGKSFERVDRAGASSVRSRIQIVGLIADARSRDSKRLPIRPMVCWPFQTSDGNGGLRPIGRGTFVVRTSGSNPLALASALRQAVPRARPGFRVSNIRTQAEIDRASTVKERLLATLALFFAVVALLLAGIGLFGVLDYSVLQQRREIGIRMAIGARGADIVRGVTTSVFAMVLTGAVAGLTLGMVSVRYIETMFYQVKATDAVVLAFPSLTILAVALVAAVPPVFRALRINPSNMLRAE
jgi:predicted permease